MGRDEVPPCNVCATTDVPRFQAGGEWWCGGCAHWQTEHSAGFDDE